MDTRQTVKPPLTRALLLIALLLAGRSFVATHHYEHDLTQLEAECDICELFHAPKDDMVSFAAGDLELAAHSSAPVIARSSRSSPPRWAYRPRAPPFSRV